MNCIRKRKHRSKSYFSCSLMRLWTFCLERSASKPHTSAWPPKWCINSNGRPPAHRKQMHKSNWQTLIGQSMAMNREQVATADRRIKTNRRNVVAELIVQVACVSFGRTQTNFHLFSVVPNDSVSSIFLLRPSHTTAASLLTDFLVAFFRFSIHDDSTLL